MVGWVKPQLGFLFFWGNFVFLCVFLCCFHVSKCLKKIKKDWGWEFFNLTRPLIHNCYLVLFTGKRTEQYFIDTSVSLTSIIMYLLVRKVLYNGRKTKTSYL